MKRALVLINPNARRAKDVDALAALEKSGMSLIPTSEKNPENFPDLIQRFKDQVDVVIIGSGDGTVHSILPTILETGLTLGVLPLGTSNNFALTLGIPDDINEAVKIIAEGEMTQVDLGFANGIPFVNAAGIGLSTQINKKISKELKKKWGPLAYVMSAFKIARRFRPFHARITHDGKSITVASLQITVCNSPYYGAHLRVTEDATMTDGILHLSSVEAPHWLKGIQALPRLLKGKHNPEKGVRIIRAHEIQIQTRKPIAVDTDGEVHTRTPVKIEIKPNALRVMVPRISKEESNPLTSSSKISKVYDAPNLHF